MTCIKLKNNKEENMEISEWEEKFYKELNPEKRYMILQENNDIDGMSDYRKKIWEKRYGKGRPRKDLYVRCLMDMKFIHESGVTDFSGARKKQAAEILVNLGLADAENYPDAQRQIILLELKNSFLKYIDVSRGGRGFTSLVFGMGQLSDDGVAKKIADQISAIAFDMPYRFKMEHEYELLQNAALLAFREVYPNREQYLRKH